MMQNFDNTATRSAHLANDARNAMMAQQAQHKINKDDAVNKQVCEHVNSHQLSRFLESSCDCV